MKSSKCFIFISQLSKKDYAASSIKGKNNVLCIDFTCNILKSKSIIMKLLISLIT